MRLNRSGPLSPTYEQQLLLLSSWELSCALGVWTTQPPSAMAIGTQIASLRGPRSSLRTRPCTFWQLALRRVPQPNSLHGLCLLLPYFDMSFSLLDFLASGSPVDWWVAAWFRAAMALSLSTVCPTVLTCSRRSRLQIVALVFPFFWLYWISSMAMQLVATLLTVHILCSVYQTGWNCLATLHLACLVGL